LISDHDHWIWSDPKGDGVPRKYRQFSPEFKDEAVRLVIEASRPIAQVARELGINEGTLGSWLRMENEFLKKVIMPAGAGTLTG
jgi:transposase-like protein